MAIDLVMPKLGLTMTEGLVQQWVAKEGVPFARGAVLLVVETEKIANEIEAVADGVLDQILVQAGDVAPCGHAIARWTPSSPHADHQPMDPFPSEMTRGEGARAIGRVVSTPYARKLARELGVDLGAVVGSGPRGRIKAPDVKAAATGAQDPVVEPADVASVAALMPVAPPPPVTIPPIAVSAPASATRRPATGFEKTTAERLSAAKQVPHFYLTTEVEISSLEALRTQLNQLEGKPKVTVTHLLLAALARTLVDLPEANQVWDRGEVVRFASIDVGLAVQTQRGLLAPVLRDLGGLRIHEVAERARSLVDRARRDRLRPEDFGGGATSLSNAGMHDVTYMTSIIAPGHSSIFGIGSVREVFRPNARGEPVLKRELGVVMSCDHRILDGVKGLAVLNRLKVYLENPLQIVV